MAIPRIESRVAALEAEVARLKRRLSSPTDRRGEWLEEISGVFTDDAIHQEAMRLGREYRESLRPKAPAKARRKTAKRPAKGRARRNVHPRH